jgi:hypothetical protein
MRVARAVSGIVDTGSPYTSISPTDAITFGLPISNWQKGEMVYLAGFKFYRHPLEAILTFKDTNSKLSRFRCQVMVLVPTKMDRGTLDEMQYIPSLVGTDFIEDQGLKLVFDPKSSEAYFEKQDSLPTTTQVS